MNRKLWTAPLAQFEIKITIRFLCQNHEINFLRVGKNQRCTYTTIYLFIWLCMYVYIYMKHYDHEEFNEYLY